MKNLETFNIHSVQLHSVDMLVFKNTKWLTCVYMVKDIAQTVVIYF